LLKDTLKKRYFDEYKKIEDAENLFYDKLIKYSNL
jgi:hypothetical protein